MERPAFDVPVWRLNIMRVLYALIAFGMGGIIWPLMFNHQPWPVMHSVANAMLAALALSCVFGIRYPLQMLPLLLFEFAWKTIWCLMIALPLWRANQLDARAAETLRECLAGVILCPLVIPWGYFWRNYVQKAAEPWRKVRVLSTTST
jgi:hypothetical protein